MYDDDKGLKSINENEHIVSPFELEIRINCLYAPPYRFLFPLDLFSALRADYVIIFYM